MSVHLNVGCLRRSHVPAWKSCPAYASDSLDPWFNTPHLQLALQLLVHHATLYGYPGSVAELSWASWLIQRMRECHVTMYPVHPVQTQTQTQIKLITIPYHTIPVLCKDAVRFGSSRTKTRPRQCRSVKLIFECWTDGSDAGHQIDTYLTNSTVR